MTVFFNDNFNAQVERGEWFSIGAIYINDPSLTVNKLLLETGSNPVQVFLSVLTEGTFIINIGDGVTGTASVSPANVNNASSNTTEVVYNISTYTGSPSAVTLPIYTINGKVSENQLTTSRGDGVILEANTKHGISITNYSITDSTLNIQIYTREVA